MGTEEVTVAVENLTERKLTATVVVTQTDLCGNIAEKKVTRTVAPLAKAGGSLWFDGYTFSTKCTAKKKYADNFFSRLGDVRLALAAVEEAGTASKTVTVVKRDSMVLRYTHYELSSGKKGLHLQGTNTRKHMGVIIRISASSRNDNKTSLENPAAKEVIEIRLPPGGSFNQKIPYTEYTMEIDPVPYAGEASPGIMDKTREFIKGQVTSGKDSSNKSNRVKYGGGKRG